MFSKNQHERIPSSSSPSGSLARMPMKKMNRVLFLGDSGVGKSSLIERCVYKRFCEDRVTTIGMDFNCKTIYVPDAEAIRLQLIDTAGQSKFHIKCDYTKAETADAIVAVYDVTQFTSFSKLIPIIEEANRQKRKDVPIFLVGNKNDHQAGARSVQYTDVNRLVVEFGIFNTFETSAKTGENVNELFLEVAKAIGEAPEDEPQPQLEIVSVEPEEAGRGFCCCIL